MIRSTGQILLLLLLLTPPSWGTEPLHIVTTIKPVHSILSGLMEGTRPPELLFHGQQLPHEAILSKEQQDRIDQADLILWVGPELEQSLTEPLQHYRKKTITLLDHPALKILPSRWNNHERDPYFWLDSRNAIILAEEMTQELISRDPARKSLYLDNRKTVFARLSALDRQLEYSYRGLQGGAGMSYYDNLQYFEQAYALKIGSTVLRSPTMPLNGSTLLTNRSRLLNDHYRCLLTEQQVAQEDINLLTQGIDINIKAIDSLGSRFEAGPDLYFKLMEWNTATISQCLQHEAIAITEDQPLLSNKIGTRFILQDHRGRPFTDRDMLGKFQLIYFGYTFCPDVCPSSLYSLTAALKQLGPLADQVQPYFITVDPIRDTSDVLSTYVGYFHPSMVGLTGSETMIERVARRYKVRYEKVNDPDRPADQYVIDHSSGLFLMGPDGHFIVKFAHGISPEKIAQRVRHELKARSLQ